MIRSARPQDAEQVIPLLHSAIGRIANTLAGKENDEEALAVIQDYFRQPGNRLSYEQVIVDEREGKVAGMLLSYSGDRANELDEPLLERIRQNSGDRNRTIEAETELGEYYLDSLAVGEDYQGQGIAKALMSAFEERAAGQGFDKVTLLVEQENERAYALYVKMGYHVDGIRHLSGYEFRRMVKRVPVVKKP